MNFIFAQTPNPGCASELVAFDWHCFWGFVTRSAQSFTGESFSHVRITHYACCNLAEVEGSILGLHDAHTRDPGVDSSGFTD